MTHSAMPAANQIVSLFVNGDSCEVGVPGHYTLLETVRYVVGLTGSKQGRGRCNAAETPWTGAASVG